METCPHAIFLLLMHFFCQHFLILFTFELSFHTISIGRIIEMNSTCSVGQQLSSNMLQTQLREYQMTLKNSPKDPTSLEVSNNILWTIHCKCNYKGILLRFGMIFNLTMVFVIVMHAKIYTLWVAFSSVRK